MSAGQNLAYAFIQVVHNFGAVAVVGGSLAAVKPGSKDMRRKPAWLALAGWSAQAISGAAFGAVSYYFYHRFPDIAGIATVALGIKVACTLSGFVLLATWLLFGKGWAAERVNFVLTASFVLAVTSLSAAAFLRWFS